MSLVDAKGNVIPDEVHKIKIHSVEIPLPTTDAQKLFKGCRIPIYGQLEISPGQTVGFVAGHQPGMNAAEALLALETSKAIEELNGKLETIANAVEQLSKAMEPLIAEVEKLEALEERISNVEKTAARASLGPQKFG